MGDNNTIQRLLSQMAVDTFFRTYGAFNDPQLARKNARKDIRRACRTLRRNAEKRVDDHYVSLVLMIEDSKGEAA